ncbi:MAG: hypothetical protein LBD41_02230 [Clostridiales Family XIII bacterium]|jgi:hypothetical protein|nr:hypothetical protein [Clostridiales Family XIII bacterium]
MQKLFLFKIFKLCITFLIPIFIVVFYTSVVNAEKTGPNIEWQKSYGGKGTDIARSIRLTSDGGYIIAGSSSSSNGEATVNQGKSDFWIVKIDSQGTLQWQKSFGGTAVDVARSIQITSDGGYIIAGSSSSNDGDVTLNHGENDYWIVKLDSNGTLEWQKSLGGSRYDFVTSIQITADSGYIVAGFSRFNDGDVTVNHGERDFWIVKLNSKGNIEWQKSYGGSNWDEANAIQITPDKGYIIAGTSESSDGDVTVNYVRYDYWIVKINSRGKLEWQKSLGGSGDDSPNDIQVTTDGGYIIAGSSSSKNGDVTSNRGKDDFWIVKLYGR